MFAFFINIQSVEVCFRLKKLRQVGKKVHHSTVEAETILSHTWHGKETIRPNWLSS